MRPDGTIAVSFFVDEKTKREMKAHIALLGLTISEYILSLYALDKENDLIKKSDT